MSAESLAEDQGETRLTHGIAWRRLNHIVNLHTAYPSDDPNLTACRGCLDPHPCPTYRYAVGAHDGR